MVRAGRQCATHQPTSSLRRYAESLKTDRETRALVVRQGADPDDDLQGILKELDFLERPAARRRYDTEHWRLVAATYDKAWATGSAPTRDVAEHFGVTRSTAGKWVSICRKMGLLPPTQKTRARGNPLTGGTDGMGTED